MQKRRARNDVIYSLVIFACCNSTRKLTANAVHGLSEPLASFAQPTIMSTNHIMYDPAMVRAIKARHFAEGGYEEIFGSGQIIDLDQLKYLAFEKHDTLRDVPEEEHDNMQHFFRVITHMYIRNKYSSFVYNEVKAKIIDGYGSDLQRDLELSAEKYFTWIQPRCTFINGHLPFSYDGMISEASLDPETPTVQERTASFDSAVKTLALDATTQTATFDKLTGFSPQVERPTMVCVQTSTGSATSTSSEEDPIPAPVQKKRKIASE